MEEDKTAPEGVVKKENEEEKIEVVGESLEVRDRDF